MSVELSGVVFRRTEWFIVPQRSGWPWCFKARID